MARLTKERAASRVVRGVRWLDKNFPGWRDRVRITKLNMRYGRVRLDDGCGCILAQVNEDHGGYFSIADARSDRWGVRLGFCAGDDEADYRVLDEAWKDEIRAGRKAAR